MAWSAPLTAVANAALNASDWNASVRDNLNSTAVALATTAGRWFVATGATALAERAIVQNTVDTAEPLVNTTTYTNIATNGPIVSSVITGTQALVFINARLSNATASVQSWASYEVTGASTVVANDNWAIVAESPTLTQLWRQGATNLHTGLTAGGIGNTFRMQYRVESASTGTFATRRLQVMAL
jgi:hypothetical protein